MSTLEPDTDGHLAYHQAKEYNGKLSEEFADHFEDWQGDYLMAYLKHDVYAYQELIALMGEPGKALPVEPEEMSNEQEEVLTELARSQTDWWSKFTQYSYEDYCERRCRDEE